MNLLSLLSFVLLLFVVLLQRYLLCGLNIPNHGRIVRTILAVCNIRIIAKLLQHTNFYVELAIRREVGSGEDEEARQISSSHLTME